MGGWGLSGVLLDTHVWAWSIGRMSLVSAEARRAIEGGGAVYVSPITFFEITQKVCLGKWPEMEPHAGDLSAILRDQGSHPAPLTADICHHAVARDWDHRDPFDRLLASTAELLGLALVTRDPAFTGLPGLRTVW